MTSEQQERGEDRIGFYLFSKNPIWWRVLSIPRRDKNTEIKSDLSSSELPKKGDVIHIAEMHSDGYYRVFDKVYKISGPDSPFNHKSVGVLVESACHPTSSLAERLKHWVLGEIRK